MKRNICLICKFKLSFLVSSAAVMKKLCLNSPHTHALLPTSALLVYTVLCRNEDHILQVM